MRWAGSTRKLREPYLGRSGSWAQRPTCFASRAPHARLRPMEWTDDGIVLGVRRHGESSAIVELLTREHGRHLGLVRGGASSRMRPLLQPGNKVTAVWGGGRGVDPGLYG